jgi:O-methyltransferase
MSFDGKEAIDYIVNNNVQGCIVECGVFHGNKEKEFITRLIELNASPRHIFMYDTFEGMPRTISLIRML